MADGRYASKEKRTFPFAILPSWVIKLVTTACEVNGRPDKIRPEDIAVYSVIALHLNRETEISYPSMRRMSAMLGMSTLTVFRSIRRLASVKAIAYKRCPSPVGGTMLVYELLPMVVKSVTPPVTPSGRRVTPDSPARYPAEGGRVTGPITTLNPDSENQRRKPEIAYATVPDSDPTRRGWCSACGTIHAVADGCPVLSTAS